MSYELLADRPAEILIAESPLESLKLLCQVLDQEGYSVRRVTSGHLALNSVRSALPDLILLNAEMPDLSGYEVCQELKADPQTADIPVIFISASQAKINQSRVFRVGGVDYITQPLHMDEVLARVHNQLALRRSVMQIHQLQAEIEQRVQKRTHQLQAVNQALTAELREQQQVEQRLRDSEEKLRQISDHIRAVFWLINIDPDSGAKTGVSYISPAFEEIWGQSRQTLYNDRHLWLETIHPGDHDRVAAAFTQLLHEGAYDEDYRIVRPDGTIRWIRDRGFPVRDQHGRVYRIAGLAEDVTARVTAYEECDHCFKLSLDLLFIADEQGQLKRVNPAWASILGYSQEELVDLNWADIIHPDELSLVQRALTTLQQGTKISELEMQCRHRDGSYVWVAWNAVPVLQEHLFYGTGRDISEHKTSEARLIYETLHDALTGLANRPCFLQRLELAIKKQRRFPKNHFAVLFIDLDGFKSVNDTLGHGVGDQLLIRIARILLQSVREVDTVARLGGDEFTVLLEDCPQPREVLEIAERIQKNLEPALHIQHHEIFTSASIGIVVGTPQYQQPAEVLRDADSAMYRAKANGKARYAVFDEVMYADTLYHSELENCLHHAIANQELEIHYQPIVSLEDDIAIEGLEVLVRWQHPQKGLIPASEFIPIAEELGLINAIGEWVLQEACMQFCRWQQLQPKFQHLYLSINISGQQLREPSLLQTLTRMLAETHIPAHCLRFEITESSLIHNTRIAAELLEQIRELGIHISLDDFGTGFSALSYLHQLPIDTIKIDRSFVGLLQSGDRERSIITAILGLSQALGLVTVAEGIETQAQLEALQALNCNAGQGFYFSPPMTPAQLEDWLMGDYQGCQTTHPLCMIDGHQVPRIS
ncbi:MAG: EAL domain-containing protein [Leptolyngbya sp. SIOISBB]|nr:EAL domain-containing protein [Leptolyngbya sp. SIOISBB]